MDATLEISLTLPEIGGIEIYRHGPNDYEIHYTEGDCSVRGTFQDIMMEFNDARGYALERPRQGWALPKLKED